MTVIVTVIEALTGAAAAQVTPSPGWEAVTEHIPAVRRLSVEPETVQTPVVVEV
jgi:hypothetical protein